MGLSEGTELVDRDDEPGGWRRSGARILLVGALPGGQVREVEVAQAPLAIPQDVGDALEGASRRPRIKVGEHVLCVGQLPQAREGRASLVVEDEADALGRIGVRDGREPHEESLGLTRTRAAGNQGVRAVGDQVQAHRPLLRLPDRHAQGSRPRACLLGPPTKKSREIILSVHSRHRPTPGRAHRSVVGDAHPRAPRRQVFHARGVTDVKDTGVTWASRAVRALLAGAHVDVDARVPEQDGGGAVPPHARPAELSGDLAGAP